MTPSHNEFVTSVPIRLVLAEGHEIVLLGLERFLSSIEDFAVVATASDGPESLAAVRAHRPDLAVLDARLPGKSGLEVAVEILREGLPTRVVLVTTRIDDRESLEALRLGIHGVLLKEMAPRPAASPLGWRRSGSPDCWRRGPATRRSPTTWESPRARSRTICTTST